MATTTAQLVTICDDSGSRTYGTGKPLSVEDCIASYYGGKCRTVADVKAHLERLGGYGYIEVDGERVLGVRP